MLNKNEIIQGLQSKEFFIKNGVYEYVCNLHLYDNEEINEALIKYIKQNYKQINFTGLRLSKLNKNIIDCLIDIYLSEKDLKYKERIEDVLIEHYSLIKDLDYNFEELLIDETNLLLYKKIKHFSKKEPNELFERYLKAIQTCSQADENADEEKMFIQEKLADSMGYALIQSEEGRKKLIDYTMEQYRVNAKYNTGFYEKEMPYLIYPLCQAKEQAYYKAIIMTYISIVDGFFENEHCNYYFSYMSEEFVDYYINILNNLKKEQIKDYFYDIAEYINSEKIDDFLLKTLKENVSQEIKKNIIRIMACKFDKRVIPFAIQYVQKGQFKDEEDLKDALTPMLMIYKCEDKTSKEIIKFAEDSIFDQEEFKKVFTEKFTKELIKEVQNVMYKGNKQIQEYRKTRKLFEKIVQDMVDYYQKRKYNLKIDYDKSKIDKNRTAEIFTEFDTSTPMGDQALVNVLVFKNAINMSSITEEFIAKNKYKKEEKIEMLQSMQNSEAGLFEIEETNLREAKTKLKNMLTGKEYDVTDLALCTNTNPEDIYMYTRIITYKNISFCSGLNIPFYKNDKFIKGWINEKKYAKNEEQEITRFLEIFNEYQKNDHGIKGEGRKFK